MFQAGSVLIVDDVLLEVFENLDIIEGFEAFVCRVVCDGVEARLSLESEAMVALQIEVGAGEAYNFNRLLTTCLSALGTGSPSFTKP
jgi:hypothetical protein